MPGNLKGIFFDAGNTLFEPRERIGETYRRIAEKYGVKIKADRLDEKFKAVFKTAPPLAFPGAFKAELVRLEQRWWRQLVRAVFDEIDFPQFDAFFEALYQHFREESAWRVYAETKAVLETLREAGYLLGIISNFDSRLISICAKLSIQDYFSIIIFSSGEGIAKPAPEIFERTLGRLGIVPSEAIYVGDSLPHDIEGARKIGMTPLLLNRSGHAHGDGKVITISNLCGIYPYIKKAPSLLKKE